MKIAKITRVALAGGMVAAAFAVATPDAKADLDLGAGGTQLVVCNGGSTNLIASLNPTIKDGDATNHKALYVKASAKRSDGTKTVFAAPIPADSTSCSVDAGIRANQAGQDVKYLLDDQAGGHATLTLASYSASLIGSTQCDNSVVPSAINEYPNAYPLQGKATLKFLQTDAALKQIQIQSYMRTYTDDDDTTSGMVHVVGTVIKGPGVGGRLTTGFGFFPTDSTKNINLVAGCTDGISGNAAGAELWIVGADSSLDADADNEVITVTIGDDDANELVPGP